MYLLCSYTLAWAFAVASARDGCDSVSPFLDSFCCGSFVFYSKNTDVQAVPLSVELKALVSL